MAEDQSAPPSTLSTTAARWAAAILFGLALLYGALYAAGRLAQPEAVRLAALDADALRIEGYGPQRAVGDDASPDALYLRALDHLRSARASTLGLFPRYDAEKLARAADLLGRVVQGAEPKSFLQNEAAFYLGQARLAQNDRRGATRALRSVVAGGGRRAPEAARQLQKLHEDAAYEGPEQ